MNNYLQLGRLAKLASLALVAVVASGCASNRCDDVQPYQNISEPELLTVPEGVAAPADSGDYRIPEGKRGESRGCLAEPPMTLPKEALQEPDDDEDAAGAEE